MPTEPPIPYSKQATEHTGTPWRVVAALTIGFFLLVLLVDWKAGTFQSEFGRNPDEGIHYVTGVLLRNFLLTPSAWVHPMGFARDFYAHYPKVGLGNWPPLFEIMQVFWSLIFGYSRVSILAEMALLTALLTALTAYVLLRVGKFPPIYACFAGVLLVLSPLTQEQSAMVMAEIPLALLSLASILAWIQYETTGRTREAVIFALLTSAAILTKGNAWVIPPAVVLALACNGSWRLLSRRSFWIAAAVIAVLCIPYTIVTMNIVTQGWNTRGIPSAAMVSSAIWAHIRFVAEVFGTPMLVLALLGAFDSVVIPRIRRQPASSFWSTMLIYGVVIILFHSLIPTSFEPRKVYQIAPVLCFFIAAALQHASRSVSARIPGSWISRAGFAAVALGLFLFTGFRWIERFTPGLRPLVVDLAQRPDVRGTAILISSNAYYQDLEAAFIAEWISRIGTNGTYLVRATKLLARVETSESGEIRLTSVVDSPQALREALLRVPIAFAVVHTTPAPKEYAYHAILQSTLAGDPEAWEKLDQRSAYTNGRPHEAELYRFRKDLRGIPVHFEIDLTQKIQQSIEVDSKNKAK